MDETANQKPLLVIAGPTASGKSALAYRLAELKEIEVVSLDSVQVYRGCDIGSAKPTKQQQQAVRHHLIDIFDPNQQGDLAQLVGMAKVAIEEIRGRNKLPVVVGGTTLYLTALLHGIDTLPKRDTKLRAELEKKDAETLYNQLTAANQARLNKSDRLRVIRALEIQNSNFEKTEASSFDSEPVPALVLVLVPERERLYSKILLRTVEIIRLGLRAEAQGLLDRWGPDIPVFKTIGYREALLAITEKLSDRELIKEISQATSRFAKRQLTYWANEPKKRGWLVSPDQLVFKENIQKQFKTLSEAHLMDNALKQLSQPLSGVSVWFSEGLSSS